MKYCCLHLGLTHRLLLVLLVTMLGVRKLMMGGVVGGDLAWQTGQGAR